MFTDEKFTFRVLSVLKLSWGEACLDAKARPYHALSMRVEGDADFIHKDKRYHVGRGCMAYVPAGYNYTIESHTRETVIVVHFEILDANFSQIEIFKCKNPDIITDVFYKMYRAWRAKEVGYEYRVESLFARVLECMMTEAFDEKYGVHPDFSTLLEFIHTNFTDPSLTVDSMAKRIGISTTYLRHLFHNNVGMSPIKYLTRLRIGYAKSLLESGYYTVEQVAKLSGYSDPKYFSTTYKKNTGTSPKGRRVINGSDIIPSKT